MNTIIIGILVVACLLLIILYARQINLNGSSPTQASSTSQESKSPSDAPETSLRDPVTDLYNRKHLLRRLKEIMSRCDRNDQQMALILWDIDGFIEFNNRYSQKEGDDFLKRVAETIRKSLREYDEAFRVGGDEFCAVLTPADEAISKDVTERVSQAVSHNLFRGMKEYADQSFSISAGVVYYPSEHTIPESLLYAAGEELFKHRPHKS